MEYKIILMPRAIKDLDKIAKYIATEAPEIAEKFTDELIDRTAPLASFPEMGRVVPEFKKTLLRELTQESYRILYRVRPATKEVHILRFWHAARGEPSL